MVLSLSPPPTPYTHTRTQPRPRIKINPKEPLPMEGEQVSAHREGEAAPGCTHTRVLHTSGCGAAPPAPLYTHADPPVRPQGKAVPPALPPPPPIPLCAPMDDLGSTMGSPVCNWGYGGEGGWWGRGFSCPCGSLDHSGVPKPGGIHAPAPPSQIIRVHSPPPPKKEIGAGGG